MVVVSCLALPALAEPKSKYYTWVDAQGNIHNTLITSDEEKQKEAPEKKTSVLKQVNPDDFPSEEEYQKKLKARADNEKPFYTWTDAEGVVRSDVRPEVLVEFSASELVYDAVFAPPFRLPNYVTSGDCCESYQNLFVTPVEYQGSASYKVEQTEIGFRTQAGEVSAGYFILPDLDSKEILRVKAYEVNEKSEFEIIGLAENFSPLYLESSASGRFVEQTWKDLAYKEVILEISDAEVKYLIIFVKSAKESAESDYILSVNRETQISE